MIFKPELPPKEGYVEILDENGNHAYKETDEYKEKQSLLYQITDLQLALAELYEATASSEEVKTNG